MDNPADAPESTDWCVGGCSSWKDSVEGIERYTDLKSRWDEMQNQQVIME